MGNRAKRLKQRGSQERDRGRTDGRENCIDHWRYGTGRRLPQRTALNKGYIVHGLKRRSSSFNTARIDHLYQDPHDDDVRFRLHFGDLTDATNLCRVVQEVQPDEIYNLGAQSHVQVSFETPEYTANSDALGTLRLLEAMRIMKIEKTCRFYQASTSELFGKSIEAPQSEKTAFYPRSPYAAAKLYAYWITVNYREGYGFHASNGILFNHESPMRGESFVTRKITRAVAAIERGFQDKLRLGNLDAKRDWGHARDYVEGYAGALCSTRNSRRLCSGNRRDAHCANSSKSLRTCRQRNRMEWSGVDEIGYDRKSGNELAP